MSDPKAIAQRAIKAIDERRDALFALSRAIHAKPELAYEEREAALRITEFLEGAGFAVERGYKDIETSYRGDAKAGGRSAHPWRRHCRLAPSPRGRTRASPTPLSWCAG